MTKTKIITFKPLRGGRISTGSGGGVRFISASSSISDKNEGLRRPLSDVASIEKNKRKNK